MASHVWGAETPALATMMSSPADVDDGGEDLLARVLDKWTVPARSAGVAES